VLVRAKAAVAGSCAARHGCAARAKAGSCAARHGTARVHSEGEGGGLLRGALRVPLPPTFPASKVGTLFHVSRCS
jgi:hypothetical protein